MGEPRLGLGTVLGNIIKLQLQLQTSTSNFNFKLQLQTSDFNFNFQQVFGMEWYDIVTGLYCPIKQVYIITNK